MTIYQTREFRRWARKQGLQNAALCRAVTEMATGLYEADLGGYLFKKRIARPGQGKSGGFRTLVATNRGSLWFFVYGFSKNEQSNIRPDEEAALKTLAAVLLALKPIALSQALATEELIEVYCDG
jgi:hypothetical protein